MNGRALEIPPLRSASPSASVAQTALLGQITSNLQVALRSLREIADGALSLGPCERRALLTQLDALTTRTAEARMKLSQNDKPQKEDQK